MLVREACIEINSEAASDDVAALLRLLTSGGPFSVSTVHGTGAGRYCCRFVLVRPDLAVGYRSVIELQHRIDRELDIVSVNHESTHFSNKDLVLS